ncbi:XRE family transcriptional regulator [Actinopolyspora mortivallis]|uniref:XRE family transcriptional regulator n=1 Tax=Actinopolyspora mortivallis TaxID=33906 RepID=UPI0015E5C01F|nr:XRE family transcriptional regulator [Actinopolyspora mortivallis]
MDNVFGQAVRDTRRARGLTLDELAARSGVSRAALSKIERGDGSPRLHHALRIAEALERPLTELASPQPETVTVVRDGTAPRMVDPDSGALREALLELGHGSELVRYTLGPRAALAPFPAHEPGTREAFLVLTGTLSVTNGHTTVELAGEDTALLPADRPHTVRNPGDETTRFLLTILRPPH